MKRLLIRSKIIINGEKYVFLIGQTSKFVWTVIMSDHIFILNGLSKCSRTMSEIIISSPANIDTAQDNRASIAVEESDLRRNHNTNLRTKCTDKYIHYAYSLCSRCVNNNSSLQGQDPRNSALPPGTLGLLICCLHV